MQENFLSKLYTQAPQEDAHKGHHMERHERSKKEEGVIEKEGLKSQKMREMQGLLLLKILFPLASFTLPHHTYLTVQL